MQFGMKIWKYSRGNEICFSIVDRAVENMVINIKAFLAIFAGPSWIVPFIIRLAYKAIQPQLIPNSLCRFNNDFSFFRLRTLSGAVY